MYLCDHHSYIKEIFFIYNMRILLSSLLCIVAIATANTNAAAAADIASISQSLLFNENYSFILRVSTLKLTCILTKYHILNHFNCIVDNILLINNHDFFYPETTN